MATGRRMQWSHLDVLVRAPTPVAVHTLTMAPREPSPPQLACNHGQGLKAITSARARMRTQTLLPALAQEAAIARASRRHASMRCRTAPSSVSSDRRRADTPSPERPRADSSLGLGSNEDLVHDRFGRRKASLGASLFLAAKRRRLFAMNRFTATN
eukprot:6180450-Pleurochrysis_carterae.AAC.2